jgi:hypothetical protein
MAEPITLEILKQIGGIVDLDAPRKRGGQKARAASEVYSSEDGRRTLAVVDEMYELGAKRGARAKAIRKVATLERGYQKALKEALEKRVGQSVKRINAQWPGLIAAELSTRRIVDAAKELHRRTLGFPEDVKAKIQHYDAWTLLGYLRRECIDGTCPKELIDAIRAATDSTYPNQEENGLSINSSTTSALRQKGNENADPSVNTNRQSTESPDRTSGKTRLSD